MRKHGTMIVAFVFSWALVSSAGCTRRAANYCPLEEGGTWVYQFSGITETTGQIESLTLFGLAQLGSGKVRDAR